MSSQTPPPSVGPVAGKYELTALIGRGGMGSVWEARHISLGTRVAIKFIEAEYADSLEAKSRFDKEARAAATIQSKHAIQIYDHGVTDDGKPYIVMELLQGEPLDKRIDRVGRLGLPETARILQQVGRGLTRAHERGIIHRDLKPENIFLVRTPDDDEEVAKVLDFGIAKLQSSPHNPGVTSSTKTGAVLGTPFYMSPEQARGLRNVDHRTDVWSLGVIAFKCVTGQLPFDGESVGDLLVKICTAPIPIPSHLVAGLPSSFDAWFVRALEREPDRRFGSVLELTDALGYAAGIGARVPVSPTAVLPSSAPPYYGGTSTPQRSPPGTPQPRPQPYGYVPSQTPPPAVAMTGSPFTKPVSPSGGRTRWVLATVGAAALGGAVVALVLTLGRAKPPAVVPTASSTHLSATASDPPPQPPASTSAASGAATTSSAAPAERAAAGASASSPEPAASHLATKPAKPTKVPVTPASASKPPPPASASAKPTPPAPPPPTPKPPKNDPGY